MEKSILNIDWCTFSIVFVSSLLVGWKNINRLSAWADEKKLFQYIIFLDAFLIIAFIRNIEPLYSALLLCAIVFGLRAEVGYIKACGRRIEQ